MEAVFLSFPANTPYPHLCDINDGLSIVNKRRQTTNNTSFHETISKKPRGKRASRFFALYRMLPLTPLA